MNALLALIKKEIKEHIRSGRLIILGIVFVLFGIMNPAIAKMTPWLYEMLADSVAQSGMLVTAITVSAMESWVQFFKNMPMALIVFILLESSIFTREYQTGTLILSLTKGLERHKVVVSKTIVLVAFWTICYWVCFGITCVYNAYFWDNSVAHNMMFSAVCWWLFGLWNISLMILFSTILRTNTGVLIATGGVVLALYLFNFLPKIKKYLPILLSDGNSLIRGTLNTDIFIVPIVITIALSIIDIGMSILIFDKKNL
ncbi:ABC-type transport system involved in multi-copper enzyme maturation, permease component [[Eubacterium] infirmum]|nr:ABC-type transport system involved in multi-copper enzyme maturation, permease component [[Eubacterium] infirmum]